MSSVHHDLRRAGRRIRSSELGGVGGWCDLSVDEWEALTICEWERLPVCGDVLARIAYTYDPAGQLIVERRTEFPEYRHTFTYDPVGNRLSLDDGETLTTYAYDPANRLKWSDAGDGRTTYTFDPAGNRTGVETPEGDITASTYDLENQLASVEDPEGAIVTFTYNALQQRVARDDDGLETQFLWDGNNLRQESDAGLTQADYTFAPPSQTSEVFGDFGSLIPQPQPYGDLVSQTREDESSFYHFDTLGSTARLTDVDAAVTDEYVYKPFGELVSQCGPTENRYLLIGKHGYYFDIETGQYKLDPRIYDPPTGRFNQEDPSRKVERDLYTYGGNDPINRIDPSGLQAVPAPASESELETLGFTAFSIERIEKMVRDGLAFKYRGKNQDYVAVISVAGNEYVAMVLVRAKTQWRETISGMQPPVALYSLVLQKSAGPVVDPAETGSSVDEVLARKSTQERADEYIDSYLGLQEERRLNFFAGTAEFALHAVPLGAAIDSALQGKYAEAGVSLAADAAFFLTGGLAAGARVTAVAGRTAGRAAVGTTARLAGEQAAGRLSRVLTMNIELGGRARTLGLVFEGGVGIARGTQGVLVLRDGETQQAAGYFGEAFLRLFGVGSGVLAEYKKASQAATAAKKAVTAATDVASKPTGRLSSLPTDGPVLSEFKPGESGFSGVYDTPTGKWHMRPSGTAERPPKLASGEAAPDYVDRTGGHQDVQADLIAKAGVGGDKTVGFAVVYNADETLTVRWNSGINQTNFQQRAVPEDFRPKIIKAIEDATGKTVKSE